MGRPEPLWQALNCNSLMTGIGCVFAGISAALVHGNADFMPSVVCVIFVIFAQLAANSYYKYYDLKSHEPQTNGALDSRELLYSGHDKLLFYKIISMSLALFALMAGCCIMAFGGLWVLLIGIFLVVAGWLMVGGWMPLAHTPWTPLFTFILFGPVTVICTCLVELFHDNPDPINWFDLSPAIYKCLVMGILAANVNLVYTYVYSRRSRTRGDFTFTASFGKKTTRLMFLINSLVAFIVAFLSYLDLAIGRRWIILSSASIVLLLNIYIWWRMKHQPEYPHVKLETIANFNVLLMGILSLIAAYIVGVADTSRMEIF